MLLTLSVRGAVLCAAGTGVEDPGLVSPLATTRVYPDRGRSTFSPPDTLRDSMALFLQVPTPPSSVIEMNLC